MGAMDDQLKALGRITQELSYMEIVIALLIWTLLKDADAMILTAHLSFDRLCQSAVAIAREKMKADPKAIQRLDSIMGQAMHLEDERNRFVHSWWTAMPGGAGGLLSRIKVTAKGQLEIQFEPNVSPDDLNRVANEMRETAAALALFMKDTGLLQ